MASLGELAVVARAERGVLLMGVLNATPDSFYDGGRYSTQDRARARIDELLSEGCDVIDIGAESTRPGSQQVGEQEQVDRAGPAIVHAASRGVVVSIDTGSPKVAREALRLGAQIVNDVTCLADTRIAEVSAEGEADLIIMHSRGSMATMKGFSDYDPEGYRDVVEDISREWCEAATKAQQCGVPKEKIWFDPGLGFHKNAQHCGEIMRRLGEFEGLGAGTVLGASRKSFIGSLDGSRPERRLGGSIAACILGLNAGVSVLRVHDVQEARQALMAFRSWQPSAVPERPNSCLT